MAATTGTYASERVQTWEGVRIVIRSWIGPAQDRAHLERQMVSAAEYGIAELAGWERAHSQSAGLGAESEEAIRLAPRHVNRVLQNSGIERFLRALRDQAAGHPVHLTTVTATHPRTLRLASIHYEVETVDAGARTTLFEAVIEVERNGRARPGIRLPGSDAYTWGPWTHY